MTEQEKQKILQYIEQRRKAQSEKKQSGESKCLQTFVDHIRNGKKPYIVFPGVCKVDTLSKTL